tara:strand:+ start:284 stop:1195 length:912 start_codon:yes stop_codon:yes gene_type:complete
MKNLDLFGNEIINNPLLRDKFIEPPFSVLDTKRGEWQNRKRKWKTLGIKSELGRKKTEKKKIDYCKEQEYKKTSDLSYKRITNVFSYVRTEMSIFDPALCEVLYNWFCEPQGRVLDPFAGGSVRGIVANYLGYKYTGIDIRKEQVDSNREQALKILEVNNQPNWYVGDSNNFLSDYNKKCDFIFSCPPYGNLEVYSKLQGELSNMEYPEFLLSYESIIKKSCNLLKQGSYACFVVGEFRDKEGNYIGFVPDTINAFKKCGMKFYNEIILLGSISSACMRASGMMKNKKVAKVHQNILVFKKTT